MCDAGERIQHGEGVVFEMDGGCARPEGVELGRGEQHLLMLAGLDALLFFGGCVVIDGGEDVLAGGGQIVVEVGPVCVVPHERIHCLGAGAG